MRRHAALAVFTVLIAAPAPAQRFEPVRIDLPPDQAEILRATFDAGYSDYYGRGLEADIARGSPDVSLLAYDRGNTKDIGNYRATDTDGVKEKALWIEPGQSHRYHAPANVNLRRGTLAFWVRFAYPVGDVHHSILSIVAVGRSGRLLAIRGRYRRILVHGPWEGNYDFEAAPWEADTWYHLAVSWDETSGIRCYVNGQFTRGADVTWQTEDLEPDRIILGSWNHWGGTERPLAIDELRIFSRVLTDEEVQAVYEGADELPAVAAEFTPEAAAHRARYLGWEGADPVAIEPAAEERTLLVRQAGIRDARAIYSQAWKVCDGDRATRWPLTYHGYSFQDEGGLIVHLQPEERWSHLRVRGHVRGELFAGEHLTRPDAEPWMPLRSHGPLLTQRVERPMEQAALTFFADPEREAEEGEEAPPPTRVREIGFYDVAEADAAGLPGDPEAYHITAEPWADWSSEIGRIMLSKYETYDRAALRCAAEPAGEARLLPMEAMRYYHLMLPPGASDRALGAIRASLWFRDLQPGTVLWALVADPIIPTRQIADFEVRAEGQWEGLQRLDLTLDTRDYVIPEGRPLWLRLMVSRDADLVWDAGEHRSRIELLIEPASALAGEYRHDQLALVKDRFIDVSEPRPWGRVPMDQLAERVGVFMELHRALADLHARFPDDEYARAVHIWTHPDEPVDRSGLQPPTVPGAPEWATYQRAALRKYLDFVHWWIDHRQAPNGEFGHGYGDDTDLVNDWLTLSMTSDPGGRIADSVRRLAEFCWTYPTLESGINRNRTDPLHAYEEGVNVICREAEMHHGNPVYLERLMLSTRAVDEHLTGMTHGFRHFKSKLYGATRIETEPPYGRDILSSTLMLHPALYLGWYSRNPRATRLVREYGDAWLDLLEEAWSSEAITSTSARKLPSEVRFADREVTGRSNVFRGYGSDNMYVALAEWTGEDRYWLPQRTWLAREMLDSMMVPDIAERMDLSQHRQWILERAEATSYDDLNPQMGNDSRTQLHYGAWKLGAPRELLLRALRDSWERIELLFPMHTWVEQSADRVWISKDLVDRMYLGGTPGYRNYIYPTHSISWRGFSPEFAAWVLETGADGLRLMAFNFEEQPQRGRVEVWRLEPGTYRIALGPDADEDGIPDEATSERGLELAKGASIDIELPARRVVALVIEQIEASGEDYYARPDLAICPQDTVIAEDGSEITVRVHNVGGGQAPQFAVEVRGDDGKPPMEATAGPLEAPADCMPRVMELTFDVPEDRRGRQFDVLVDPANEIRELYEGNNLVELPAG